MEREDQVNRGLRSLDESHRLGRISRDEYRARRRSLLGSLRDSQGITARNTLRRPTGGPQGNGQFAKATTAPYADVLPTMFEGRPGWFGRRNLLLLAGAGALLALLLYGLLRIG